MPGDAADDMYDAEMARLDEHEAMIAAGCRPCLHPATDADGVCVICDGMGWLDSDGDPCEP